MTARPGPWLRLTALAGTAGVAVVVATGAWGLAHDVAAHVTLALLAATVLAARLAHPDRPELLVTAGTSFLLFSGAGLAALAGAPAWASTSRWAPPPWPRRPWPRRSPSGAGRPCRPDRGATT